MDTRSFSKPLTALLSQILVPLVMLTASYAGANALTYPENTVDGLMVFPVERLAEGIHAENVMVSDEHASFQLDPDALTGSLTLDAIPLTFPANEIIPSWNGFAPDDAGFRVWMRATGRGVATPWVEAGSWGSVEDGATTRIIRFPGGMYDVDTLVLDAPADTLQVRIDLMRPKTSIRSPQFNLLAFAITNSLGDRKLHRQFGEKRPMLSKELANLKTTESLRLPFRSQVVPRKEIISRICAAAALSLTLEHHGIDLPTQTVAEMIFDRPSDAFGVWNRVVQGAAQKGVPGVIKRLRSWDAVREEIAHGNVVIASIRFKLGELKEPPREYLRRGTEGHLIAIDGFAPGGKIIVNNSATKDWGHGELWLQEDLARAWFEKGGVAMVFAAPERQSRRR